MGKVVNIIVIVNKKFILLAESREGDFWTFPGGRVDQGESKKKAAIREWREELPKIKILEIIYYKKFKGITPHTKKEVAVYTFFAGIKGTPIPGAEVKKTVFISTNFLKKLKLTNITKEIIDSLYKDGYLIR